ncbi:MAG: hypothetical protein ABIO19_03885 [Burkholderiaceae bacterium]
MALSLLPLFGMRHRTRVEQALLSATAMLIGNTTLQFPLGWLSDRIGRARVHIGCELVVLWLGAATFIASLLWERRPAFIAKILVRT